MVNSSRRCPKCGNNMAQGFVIDSTHGGHTVSQWLAGGPVKSFWSGVKVNSKEGIPIGTYRCTACGFLESYANQDYGPK